MPCLNTVGTNVIPTNTACSLNAPKQYTENDKLTSSLKNLVGTYFEIHSFSAEEINLIKKSPKTGFFSRIIKPKTAITLKGLTVLDRAVEYVKIQLFKNEMFAKPMNQLSTNSPEHYKRVEAEVRRLVEVQEEIQKLVSQVEKKD